MEVEARRYIQENWKDLRVANWVINKLPLLELGNRFPPCPIYTISISDGLSLSRNLPSNITEFQSSKKLVISGGFEGTAGHMSAIKDMEEARIFTDGGSHKVVIMLEPDSYIRKFKEREPLMKLNERSFLWSTSSLVDAVILLPEREQSMSKYDHYASIAKAISPATWCVNVENKHKQEILTRSVGKEGVNLNGLFINKPEVHASFLHSTMNMDATQVEDGLFEYLLKLLKSGQFINTNQIDIESLAAVLLNDLTSSL